MRYWGMLAAKLAAVAGLMAVLWFGLNALWPKPDPSLRIQLHPFATDLWYTAAVMVLFLIAVGLVYLAILDQRYRCRTCGRRLRMPVRRGGWNVVLLGRPTLDYICAYGHGTLRVPELGITAPEQAAWEPIDDMWRELEELQTSGK